MPAEEILREIRLLRIHAAKHWNFNIVRIRESAYAALFFSYTLLSCNRFINSCGVRMVSRMSKSPNMIVKSVPDYGVQKRASFFLLFYHIIVGISIHSAVFSVVFSIIPLEAGKHKKRYDFLKNHIFCGRPIISPLHVYPLSPLISPYR